MALESVSASLEEGEELQRQLVEDQNAPSHNPSAPPDELFDIPTTVDPSYIISLIRKLLPMGERSNCDVSDNRGQNNDRLEKSEVCEVGVYKTDGKDMDIDVVEDSDEFSRKGEENVASVREEAWEEYGCILWDLAASKDHAELMVARSRRAAPERVPWLRCVGCGAMSQVGLVTFGKMKRHRL